jgi:hypothetical protein
MSAPRWGMIITLPLLLFLFVVVASSVTSAAATAPAWHPARFRSSGGRSGTDVDRRTAAAHEIPAPRESPMLSDEDAAAVAITTTEAAATATAAASDREEEEEAAGGTDRTASTASTSADDGDGGGGRTAEAEEAAEEDLPPPANRHLDAGFSTAGGDAKSLRRTPLPSCALHVFRHVSKAAVGASTAHHVIVVRQNTSS